MALIERAKFGQGAAYSTSSPLHLLNVPAGRMGALPDDIGGFYRFLQSLPDGDSTGGRYSADDYVPRLLYRRYLEQFAPSPGPGVGLINEEAIDLESNGGLLTVITDTGRRISARNAVLAAGNLPPGCPHPDLRKGEWYRPNPWNCTKGTATAKAVLLIGAGLTAVDLILTLGASSEFSGKIFVVSRHGHFPLPHLEPGATAPAPAEIFSEADCRGGAAAVFQMLRTKAQESSLDYRLVCDALRPRLQQIWQKWDDKEKRRFLRHLRPIWEIHRHRIPASIDQRIRELAAQGRLELIGGRIAAVGDQAGRAAVTIRRRHVGRGCSDAEEQILADLVINCTGPNADLRLSGERLFLNAFESGLIRPGPCGIGLDATADGAVISADGKTAENLFACGPLLRGVSWETTAVPELRCQAAAIARRIAAG